MSFVACSAIHPRLYGPQCPPSSPIAASSSFHLPPPLALASVLHHQKPFTSGSLSRPPRSPRIFKVQSSEADLQEVDPITGEVIEGTSLASAAPSLVTAADGFTWAFRRASGEPGKLPVLCLHGLGSSSYAYRNTARLLGADGHETIALDWLGHGASRGKPRPERFDFTADSYVKALGAAVDALDISQPFALVVHGYVLGQYGMLWALENPDKVAKLIIINVPLALSSKLRPELAAYKAPLAFLRPKPDAPFNAANYNAAGGPYAMNYRDAQAFQAPYDEDSAAAAAIYSTMDALDWQQCLGRVDEGFATWRVPSLVVHGSADQFLDLKGPLEWLDSKRTCMKMATGIEAKLGHVPHEDYPEAIHPSLVKFLNETEP